jgi:hypothetical protein
MLSRAAGTARQVTFNPPRARRRQQKLSVERQSERGAIETK